jgi:hypothetical protein
VENHAGDKHVNPRSIATMATNARLVRLVVESVPPSYVFSVREISKGDGSLKRPIATGVTDSLNDARAKAEFFAIEYLSQDIEQATIPFWIEEAI